MNKKVILLIAFITAITFSAFCFGQKEEKKGALHVTGPITAGERGWPQMGYYGNPAHIGYVEEEFFIEGNAAHYTLTSEWTKDGKWTLEKGYTSPYKTRLLVHRPAKDEDFNGTVVIEWANVSSGYEMAFVDIQGMVDMPDCGFAFVLASVQPISVNGFTNPGTSTREVRAIGTNVVVQAARADLTVGGLKNWDPLRYGSLHIPDEGASYDIFTQAGIAVGPNRKTLTTGVDAMGGLTVKKLIGIGGSQSGIRLLSYANGIQPIENVYDALVPAMGSGQGVDFKEELAADPTVPGYDAMAANARRIRPALIRDDLAIPVMIFNSEAEVDWTAEARQPDTDKFRHWEVAGASHGGPKMKIANLKSDRDSLTFTHTTSSQIRATEIDWQPVLSAALWHIHNWVTDGTLPPSFEPIKVEVVNGRIEPIRDQYGNAVGGVRLPELEVPFANYSTNYRNRMMPSSYTIPFSPAYMKQLYPTHAVYLAKYTEAVNKAKADGVILERSAQLFIQRARNAPIPEQVYPDVLKPYLK